MSGFIWYQSASCFTSVTTSPVAIVMSEGEVPSAIAQRIVINFLPNEQATDILGRVCEQFCNETLSLVMIKWHKFFLSLFQKKGTKPILQIEGISTN